jgi:hypothetical protein
VCSDKERDGDVRDDLRKQLEKIYLSPIAT